MRAPFRALVLRVSCYFGDLKTDPNLENYPNPTALNDTLAACRIQSHPKHWQLEPMCLKGFSVSQEP